jgi:hypothetical protein
MTGGAEEFSGRGFRGAIDLRMDPTAIAAIEVDA